MILSDGPTPFLSVYRMDGTCYRIPAAPAPEASTEGSRENKESETQSDFPKFTVPYVRDWLSTNLPDSDSCPSSSLVIPPSLIELYPSTPEPEAEKDDEDNGED